jgi:hypothetical protein
VTESLSDAIGDAARRIEHWLVTSPVQIQEGQYAGGVAGWLDADGCPAFVYLEITGYYLTAAAWLINGGARSPDSVAPARRRGRLALDWLGRELAGGALPPTRAHLRDRSEPDWRNDAVFTFDLAMASRGVRAFADTPGPDHATGANVQNALERGLEDVRQGRDQIPSHRAIHDAVLPGRWSTRPGPHLLKAAAGLMSLSLGADLLAAARTTWTSWAEQADAGWSVHELHPFLYGLEGLVMNLENPLDRAEVGFQRLMQAQDSGGWLPDRFVDGTVHRSDVLSQALRMGALLRASGRLQSGAWAHRLDLLAGRLLEHVRPDGSVTFSHDQDRANAWCAMFAHQALVLLDSCNAATGDLVRRYLV